MTTLASSPTRGPQQAWMRQIADRLSHATAAQWAFAVGSDASLPLMRRTAWAIDAALFGKADGLAPTELPSISAAAEGWLITLVDTELSPQGKIVQLRAGGLPACQLQRAVDAAARTGDGMLELELRIHEPDQQQRSVLWHVYLNERSLNRSFDLAADKLALMAARFAADPAGFSNDSHASALPIRGRREWHSPLMRAMRHAARRVGWRDQWAVTVFRNVPEGTLWPADAGIDLLPPPDRFWADPFVCRHDGLLWVFMEELPYATQRGRLIAVSVDDAGRVSEPMVALEEPWHLSYPNVFMHEGQWYMIPESGERRSIMLYRAVRFPDRWELVSEPVTNLRTADSTLHHDGQRWWLTCSAASDQGCIYDELHVFSADKLIGPWQASPHNPVRVDPSSSRPAGPWFRHQGRWVRPAQDCRRRYGRATQLLAVKNIDERGVQDEPLASLETPIDAAAECVHTYCRVGGDLAVDWLRWRSRLGARPVRGAEQICLHVDDKGARVREEQQ
jgi:hypothetical protein